MWAELIGGTIANISLVAGYEQNKKNEENQKLQNYQDWLRANERYNLDRIKAEKDFAKTNAYNSPAQQMQRLREAGLNPNLIYGQGAQNTAAMIRGTQFSPDKHDSVKGSQEYVQPALQALQAGLTQGLQNRQIQAQTDNLNEQNGLIKKEGMYKDALTAKTLVEAGKGKLDWRQAQAVYDQTVKRAYLENQNLSADLLKKAADTTFTLDANQRASIINSANLAKTMQEIIESKMRTAKGEQEIQNLKTALSTVQDEAKLKKIEAELAESGVNKTDPWYIRILIKKLLGLP